MSKKLPSPPVGLIRPTPMDGVFMVFLPVGACDVFPYEDFLLFFVLVFVFFSRRESKNNMPMGVGFSFYFSCWLLFFLSLSPPNILGADIDNVPGRMIVDF